MAASQTVMVPSSSAPASNRPSGENSTEVNFSGPVSLRTCRPCRASHSRTVPSLDAEAKLRAIGCERQFLDRTVVTGEHRNATSIFHVPEPNGLVRTGRSEQLAVRMERQRVCAGGVPGKRRQVPAGGDIPEADVVFIRQMSRGQNEAVVRKCNCGGRSGSGMPADDALAGRSGPRA